MEDALNLGTLTVDHGDPFRNFSLKEKLMQPARNQDSSKLFKNLKTSEGDFFIRPIGREIDKFDHLLVKFYGNPDRNALRPIVDENGDFTSPPKIDGKWTHNAFSPKLI